MNNNKTTPRLKKKISIGHIIATIVVIFGSITMLFPFLWMISASFKTNTECYSTTLNFFPKKIILDSYKEILTDKSFYRSIGYTMIIEVSVIVVGTLVSSLAAFAFSKLKMKFRKTLLLLLMSSMMVPYAAIMLPQYRAFLKLNMVETLWPLILPGLFGNVSMMFFLITYMKEGIADSIIESAKIDGASYLKMWWDIALPLAKPAIVAQGIFWLVGIWNDFFGPSIYLTNPNVQTLQIYITSLNASNDGTNFPAIMTGAFLASLPMIIIFLCFQDLFINSIAVTGQKEG